MDNAADFALCGFVSVEGVIFFALLNPDKQDFFLGIARIAVLREEP